jgi:hypothetical protein
MVLFVFAAALAIPWCRAAEDVPSSFAETALEVTGLVAVGNGSYLHSRVQIFGDSPNPWRNPVV